MKSKYFNTWEFEQALFITKSNPYESKIKFEQYLNKYPKDYSAYPYYATVLIILGEFESAKKILDYVENLAIANNSFKKDKEKYHRLKKNILANRVKLLSYQEKYEELYYFCINNLDDIIQNGMKPVFFYSMKKTGRLIDDKRENNSYQFRQIVNYKEEDFLNSVQIHFYDYNQNQEDQNKNIFNKDFPFAQVLSEIKQYLPSDKRLFYGYFEDQYIFKYSNCGKEDTNQTDYFKVICFHNTSDIITIFPTTVGEYLPQIDLTHLTYQEKETKVRRLSQIDKFNQRYKK